MTQYDKKILDLYTDYLITSFGQTTATGLSQLLNYTVSHDSITRMLTHSHFDSEDLWKFAKPFIRKIQSPTGIVIIDDCVMEKPHMSENAIVNYHYDHSKGKTVRGINFLTCCYESIYQDSSICLPVQVEVVMKDEKYFDDKHGEYRYRSTKTKNQIYQESLLKFQATQTPYQYIVNDVWYASVENMIFVQKRLNKHFVMPIKTNRQIRIYQEFKKENEKMEFQSVELFDLLEDVTYIIQIKGLPFTVNLIRHIYRNEDGSEGVVHLVTNDQNLRGLDVLKIYQRRWKIEPYHKSLKQNTNLTKSPASKVRTQQNHVLAAVFAYIKLEGLKILSGMNHFAMKAILYVDALKASRSAFERLKLKYI